MLVGLIGDERDIHVLTLMKRLSERDCRVDVINLPHANILFNGEGIWINDRGIEKYDAFYIRQIPYFLPAKFFEKMSRMEWENLYNEYIYLLEANNERMGLYTSVIKAMEDNALLINPFSTLFMQFLKPFQFYLLRKRGLPVPPYVVTSVDSINVEKYGVCKPLGSYARAERMSDERVRTILRERPVILQEYVHGKIARASLLEDEFIGAVEIIHKGFDSRTTDAKYEKISLDDESIEILFKCISTLKMKYTEIDFIISNEKVFILDCNPSPGFMILEEGAHLPISEKIADYIVRKVRK